MSDLPQQQYNPGITAEDIPTPWVLFAQGQTKADVEYGSIYAAIGTQIKTLVDPPKGVDTPGERLRFYVLRGPDKRWGYIKQADNSQWVQDEYPNPQQIAEAKGNPFLVFDYVIGMPDVDERLPYKIRFKRTGADAAKQINLALLFAGPGNESTVAFELALVKRVTDYKFVVPTVRTVEVPALQASKDAEKLDVLRPLAGTSAPTPQLAAATTPALD
jgi:hypothetical protein